MHNIHILNKLLSLNNYLLPFILFYPNIAIYLILLSLPIIFFSTDCFLIITRN